MGGILGGAGAAEEATRPRNLMAAKPQFIIRRPEKAKKISKNAESEEWLCNQSNQHPNEYIHKVVERKRS